MPKTRVPASPSLLPELAILEQGPSLHEGEAAEIVGADVEDIEGVKARPAAALAA